MPVLSAALLSLLALIALPAATASPTSNEGLTLLPEGASSRPPSTASPASKPGPKNFKYFGVNLAGPEFGEKTIPGLKGKEFIWPNLTTIDAFQSKGMNTFRIALLAERTVQGRNPYSKPMDEYMNDLKSTVEGITAKGAYAIINPHNYGRWYGEIRKDHASFELYWKRIATIFAANEKVIFDTDNEFHDSPQDIVVAQNQAAINGIRAAGAKTQLIHVEGNAYTGAWTWTGPSENGKTMGALKDPADPTGSRLVFQMHQYLDSDGSGTKPECVNATIGSERLVKATQWLRDNKKQGFLGEFAAGDNAQCKAAIEDMLKFLVKNKDVWMGAAWWAAGPWWNDYYASFEPPKGKGWVAYADLLAKYA